MALCSDDVNCLAMTGCIVLLKLPPITPWLACCKKALSLRDECARHIPVFLTSTALIGLLSLWIYILANLPRCTSHINELGGTKICHTHVHMQLQAVSVERLHPAGCRMLPTVLHPAMLTGRCSKYRTISELSPFQAVLLCLCTNLTLFSKCRGCSAGVFFIVVYRNSQRFRSLVTVVGLTLENPSAAS